MIYGHIDNITSQQSLAPAIQKCLAFLRDTDLEAIELGRHDLEGDNLFANVMAFDTAESNTKQAEVHKEYLDVQCLIYGEEMIEFGNQHSNNRPATEYDSDNDFFLVENVTHSSELKLQPNMFAIFFPGEPHKPGCSVSSSKPIKKIVIKLHKDCL